MDKTPRATIISQFGFAYVLEEVHIHSVTLSVACDVCAEEKIRSAESWNYASRLHS